MISYGLLDILRQRKDQESFHVASEKALRVEFMRFSSGQKLGPLIVGGDVVMTCLEGTFEIGVDPVPALPLTQVVIPEGEVVMLVCTSAEGAVQIIWAPAFCSSTPVAV